MIFYLMVQLYFRNDTKTFHNGSDSLVIEVSRYGRTSSYKIINPFLHFFIVSNYQYFINYIRYFNIKKNRNITYECLQPRY